jgi:hypothetical protein
MNVSEIYLNSLLAQMTYSDGLNENMDSSNLANQLTLALGSRGVTQSQAQYFSDNFQVVKQKETTASGFSATLFERLNESGKGTGEFFLSMRGSDGLSNIIDWTDANLDNVVGAISRNQTIDMLNFYLELTGSTSEDVAQFELKRIESREVPAEPNVYSGPVGMGLSSYLVLREKPQMVKGLGVINSDTPLALTGHSLGAHLASEFTLLFPNAVTETVTFNSAGFIGWSGNEIDPFNTLIASTVSQVTTIQSFTSGLSSVTDVTAPLDFVSNRGTHLGAANNQFEVQVESVPSTPFNIISNHAIDRLSDSLAVINFMYTLDNSITIENANVILQQSANQMNLSLEGLINHFAELFNASPVTVTDSDHDSIYELIEQITGVVGFTPNQFVIESVDSDLVTLAQGGDQAALYTLINAQPFVIRGVDQATTDSLYSATGDDLDLANYTEQYLQDRAQYLTHLLQYNANDGEPTSNSPNISTLESYTDAIVGDTIVSFNSTSGQPVVISDELATTLGVDADGYRYTIFDNDEGNEELEGKDQNDHIYGAGGNDTLDGGKGNDYLALLPRVLRSPVLVHPARQGGVGNNTYRFDYGDGRDVIVGNGMAADENQLVISHTEGGVPTRVIALELLAGINTYKELDVDGNVINSSTTYQRVSGAVAGQFNLLISIDGGKGGSIIHQFDNGFAHWSSSFLCMSKETNQRKHIPQSSPSDSLTYAKNKWSALCHFPVARRLKSTSCCLNPLFVSTLGLMKGKLAA